MGNSQSLDDEASSFSTLDLDGLPTLDALGGYNRPAVSRSNQLETKLQWLGLHVQNTADSMDNVLQKDLSKARLAMNDLGGSQALLRPKNKTISVFGRMTTVPVETRVSAYTPKLNDSESTPLRRSFPHTHLNDSQAGGGGRLRPCSSDNSTSGQVRRQSSSGVNGAGPGMRAPRAASGRSESNGRMRRLSLVLPPSTFMSGTPLSPSSPGREGSFGRPQSSYGASPNAPPPGFRGSPSIASSSSPPVALSSRRRMSVDGMYTRQAYGNASLLDSQQVNDLQQFARTSAPQQAFLAASSSSGRIQPTPPSAPRAGRSRSSTGLQFSATPVAAASTPRRRLRAASAMTVPPQVETVHWRKRVRRVKRRLYWYLKAYMAWVSILRRKRAGYADEMPIDVLPVFIANVLGFQTVPYGELVRSLGQSASEASDRQARMSALRKSRRYLSSMRAAVQANLNEEDSAETQASTSNSPGPASDQNSPYSDADVRDLTMSSGDAADASRRPSWASEVSPDALRSQEAEVAGIGNRANASWVEARGSWHAPQVLDMASVASHADLYRQVTETLWEAGKIAVNLVYVGEEQATRADAMGNESREPLLTIDLWEAIHTLFPHKVPRGQRILGLSLLSRRIIQTIVDIERFVGQPGVDKLVLMLSIDSMYVDWVLAELLLYRHYCLQPEQIIIVSIARYPGCTYDSANHVFALNYDAQSREPAGSGYAFLAMAWASSTFWLDAMGERQYLSGSCLQWLLRNNVDWIHSSMVADFEQLSPTGPSVTDISFMGPAIFAYDHRGSFMAMEVMRAPTDAMVRRHGNVVLSPDAMEPFSCAISMKDMASSPTRAVLAMIEKSGHAPGAPKSGQYVSCTHRYLYNVQHLKNLVRGPIIFRPDVSCTNAHVYVSLEQTDLTSVNVLNGSLQSKCVAVMGRHRGPDVRAKVQSREWLRDFGGTLMGQDTQDAFRALVSRSSIRSTAAGSSVSANVAHPQDRGIRMVLYVTDSLISNRSAFRVVRTLMRSAADTLTLVYVVASSCSVAQGVTADVEKMMGSYHDVLLDAQIERRAISKGDKVVQSILDDIESVSPDLVIIGSEELSHTTSPVGAAGAAAMSVALALARGLRDVPLLIVKINSAGRVLQSHDAPGVLPPLRVLLEASTAGANAAAFIFARLYTGFGRMAPNGEDKVYIGRPYGLDKDNRETSHSARLIASVARDAGNYRIATESRPILKGATEGFPAVIAQDMIDMLVVAAPNSNATPPLLIELIKAARCAVLIHRSRGTSAGLL